MTITRIASGAPWEALVGYCRAVVAPPFVFVSGTVGRNPDTGELPVDVESQCANALTIIGRALATAGTDFAHVVRVTYYLADRADFEPCWPQLRAAFGAHPPASTVIFADLLDPVMKIEIEVTAALPAS
ncbi:RidA family protein [Sandarakinorhabdus limnophila]|jgi:enamine deaminase RidA (YjgF/YER057c/UK114 family)|uniref:RidA family protein n=1 Tax=Sandarakinorhabdus limnophila TaxID=210512 RepID=UPI0003B49586|nr:RidA family protein [Sandarakinorhabdus limnophila]